MEMDRNDRACEMARRAEENGNLRVRDEWLATVKPDRPESRLKRFFRLWTDPIDSQDPANAW